MSDMPDPLPVPAGYEKWKKKKIEEWPVGTADTSVYAYSTATQDPGVVDVVEEPTIAEQYGEIYATPDRAGQAARMAARGALGGQGVGALEAAGMDPVVDPIGIIADQAAVWGPAFRGAGIAWRGGKRLLGLGGQAAQVPAKAAQVAAGTTPVVQTPAQRAAEIAARTHAEAVATPGPAAYAGATTPKEVAEASRLWNVPGLERFASKYFGRWFKKSDAIGREGVTGTPGVPLTGWHATNRPLSVMDPTAGREAVTGTVNFAGPGNYVTTSMLDAAENYAKITGVDLVPKLTGRYNVLVRGGMEPGAASIQANKEIWLEAGKKWRLMPLHLSVQKPLVLDLSGRRAPTMLSTQQTVKGYFDYMVKNNREFGEATAKALVDDIVAHGRGIKSTDLFSLLEANYEKAGNIINHIARHSGHDGIVMHAKSYFKGMPGVVDDTYHYVTFAKNQTKSAYHGGQKHRGLFGAKPNIYYGAAGGLGLGAGAAAVADDDEEQ
jgi:hypothetical protein